MAPNNVVIFVICLPMAISFGNFLTSHTKNSLGNLTLLMLAIYIHQGQSLNPLTKSACQVAPLSAHQVNSLSRLTKSTHPVASPSQLTISSQQVSSPTCPTKSPSLLAKPTIQVHSPSPSPRSTHQVSSPSHSHPVTSMS